MQLDAASRSAHLKVVQIKEPDARHAHDRSPKIVQLPRACLSHELIEHMPCGGEPVPIWRSDAAAKVGIVRFNDQPRAWIVRVLQNNMYVVIALALHAADSADDLIHVEFFFVDAVISGRTAVSRNGIEGSDGRFDRDIQRNTVGVAIPKALHAGAVEETARTKRCKCEHRGNPARGSRVP
jgi:hypothetical protein